MITINKNNSNTVILTLQEKCLLANPYFLFQFKSVQTNISQYFLPADISTQKERYNEFMEIMGKVPGRKSWKR